MLRHDAVMSKCWRCTLLDPWHESLVSVDVTIADYALWKRWSIVSICWRLWAWPTTFLCWGHKLSHGSANGLAKLKMYTYPFSISPSLDSFTSSAERIMERSVTRDCTMMSTNLRHVGEITSCITLQLQVQHNKIRQDRSSASNWQ